MHPEKYSLTWHAYSDHLKCMMKEMMMNEDFSDVTLVTEDKKQMKANINILSACSPVFKDILKKDKYSNTIMYLRGVQYSELESIMHFIYLGEATFYEERMDELLAVAKSLEIKELCNAETEPNDEPEDYPLQNDQDTSTELAEEQTAISGSFVKVTGKYKTYSSSSKGFVHHKQSVHEGIKYACDQCEYQATTQWTLTRHIQSQHEGIKYACDLCDYLATTQWDLTRHIQSKHEGLRYACDQCDYQATLKSNLLKHIKNKHK